jgi:hypothetical protein
MPTPRPKPKEMYKNFISRFMKDRVAIKEYPDYRQRFAVAVSIWNESK